MLADIGIIELFIWETRILMFSISICKKIIKSIVSKKTKFNMDQSYGDSEIISDYLMKEKWAGIVDGNLMNLIEHTNT
jgi:hypothetical protein